MGLTMLGRLKYTPDPLAFEPRSFEVQIAIDFSSALI
jgi:hypothetical protein